MYAINAKLCARMRNDHLQRLEKDASHPFFVRCCVCNIISQVWRHPFSYVRSVCGVCVCVCELWTRSNDRHGTHARTNVTFETQYANVKLYACYFHAPCPCPRRRLHLKFDSRSLSMPKFCFKCFSLVHLFGILYIYGTDNHKHI